MPAFSASAPGKIILFGEHAVVYGYPAIAVPIHQIQAKVYIVADPTAPEGQIKISAPDIQFESTHSCLTADHPFARLITSFGDQVGSHTFPAMRIKIKSDIPIAAGLGSGTAVSVAMIRAMANFLGIPFSDEQISELAYKVEEIYHGNPSGIDNTVVTYAQPILFNRRDNFIGITVASPISLIIADSGIKSQTSDVVSFVRSIKDQDPERIEGIFKRIGEITNTARRIIEAGIYRFFDE